MAQTILRLNQKVFHVFGIFSVLLLIQRGDAFQFRIGGASGNWTVPSDPNTAIYNQWAEHSRFQIGDTLLFVYAADKDSVLHVTKDDYTNCNTATPIEKLSDGHTVFTFNQSGPYYFISGVHENCQKNEKMVVVVMADRSNRGSSGTASSPPPSPVAEMPAPSPAPSGEETPSPPSGETNPTPAPSQESSPPGNGASSIVTGVLGTVAVFVGSSLVLAI